MHVKYLKLEFLKNNYEEIIINMTLRLKNYQYDMQIISQNESKMNFPVWDE